MDHIERKEANNMVAWEKWQVQGNIPLKEDIFKAEIHLQDDSRKRHKKTSIEINFENLGNEKKMTCKNESEWVVSWVVFIWKLYNSSMVSCRGSELWLKLMLELKFDQRDVEHSWKVLLIGWYKYKLGSYPRFLLIYSSFFIGQ